MIAALVTALGVLLYALGIVRASLTAAFTEDEAQFPTHDRSGHVR